LLLAFYGTAKAVPFVRSVFPQRVSSGVEVGERSGLTGCEKTHALYQGTALAGPLTSREEGFSPWAFSWRPSGKIKEFVRDAPQQGLKPNFFTP
jgi:hypothetical protein